MTYTEQKVEIKANNKKIITPSYQILEKVSKVKIFFNLIVAWSNLNVSAATCLVITKFITHSIKSILFGLKNLEISRSLWSYAILESFQLGRITTNSLKKIITSDRKLNKSFNYLTYSRRKSQGNYRLNK